MQKISALILFLIFASISNVRAEEIIKKGENLSLQRCVEISLMRQPDIIAASSAVNANRSRVGQLRADYYPQIDWASSYSRSDSVVQYTNGVTLKQNIFDFGKRSEQVQIQNLNLDSSRSDLKNVSAQVILNVNQAYYGVLKAMRNRDVAEESVKQFLQHLEQAKGFYKFGTKPKFDVTKAEVDLSNSKLNLIKTMNALKIAVATLNNAMGVPDAPEYDIEDNLSYQAVGITFEAAIVTAYKNRPDLESVIFKKQAAERSIVLAKKGYYPALTGNASYNWTGEEPPLNEGWNVGATLSFPIFSGFLTKHQVEEARANLNVLSANEESLKQAVFLDVQQAYLNLKDAEERIPAAELVVRQAEENLELASGRYAAGVGNPIEVTDAQVSLSNAKTSYIEALYDYRVSQASLEKAMGVR